ncbi:EamA family transporter [Iocasia frigidifontis]|uniref:EamA family transporter n=1 Tax=Iocasia fonsfrigidae TaxID=2682810 RepID=A0A8A7K9W5_9FIRM|nr:DMT family transporter [Iocasia fonsfrigidae]QTL98556.1 EamA family transporter [Iocasia fonsfrigidae]
MILKNKQYKGDLLLIIVVMLWGSTFPIMKYIIEGINPFFLIAVRFTVALLALLFFLKNRVANVSHHSIKKGLMLGLLLFSGYCLQVIGLKFTTASRSSLITGLAVVIVPLILVFMLKKIPDLFSCLGIILSIIGLFLLTETNGNQGFNYGDFLTVLCSFFFALHIVLLDKYLKKEDPFILTFIQLAVTAIAAYLLAYFDNGIGRIDYISAAVILYTGLLATALAYYLQSCAQQYTTPTHAALVFTLEPVFGALFSFLFLGEALGRNGLTGGFFIIFGMLLAELKPGIKKKRRLSNG